MVWATGRNRAEHPAGGGGRACIRLGYGADHLGSIMDGQRATLSLGAGQHKDSRLFPHKGQRAPPCPRWHISPPDALPAVYGRPEGRYGPEKYKQNESMASTSACMITGRVDMNPGRSPGPQAQAWPRGLLRDRDGPIRGTAQGRKPWA